MLFVVSLASCNKDYLDTAPTSSTGSSTIFENVDNVELAINGLYKCMTQQYSAYGQGWNGEGTIKFYLGEFGGHNLNRAGTGNVAAMNHSYHDNISSSFVSYPWYYYYRIIGNANAIIDKIDDAKGPEDKKAYLKAQALTMRAYCYSMLTQLFHHRWSDGKNDEARNGNGLVLITKSTDEGLPLSSANATYELIYSDLNSAIPALEKETYRRKVDTENYQIDASVAYAIFARAALNREDYANASKYAKLAYKNYSLMSNTAYLAGFCNPTSEWIWSSYGGLTETLYYYSYFAYIAYNANTSNVRTYPSCIDKPLYNTIPDSDIRKGMFLDPESMAYSQTTGKATTNSPLYKKAFSLFPDLTKTAQVAAYMQFKVKCIDGVGVGHLNHFRASEMYLIEAEAAYKTGDESSARAALIKLTKDTQRDPNYTCTKTGADLFNEIKLYRRIELWGEGFSFFDIKRWGDAVVRLPFNKGGNTYSTYAVTVNPTDYNNLTNVVPKGESDYNDAIQ